MFEVQITETYKANVIVFAESEDITSTVYEII